MLSTRLIEALLGHTCCLEPNTSDHLGVAESRYFRCSQNYSTNVRGLHSRSFDAFRPSSAQPAAQLPIRSDAGEAFPSKNVLRSPKYVHTAQYRWAASLDVTSTDWSC